MAPPHLPHPSSAPRYPLAALAWSALACLVACSGAQNDRGEPAAAGTAQVAAGGAAGAEIEVGGAENGGSQAGGAPPTIQGGAAGDATAPEPECEEQPTPWVSDGVGSELSIELQFDGAPFERGDVVVIEDREIRIGQFLFFVSQTKLEQAGQSVAADLVEATSGAPEAYRVHLFDLEDPASHRFHLRAPAGVYQRLQLAIGLPTECNWGNPADRVPPLDASSLMNWTWNFGYIFFRLDASSAEAALPAMSTSIQVHGGAVGGAEALLSIPGPFTFDGSASHRLVLELRPMLELAATTRDHLSGGRAVLDALPEMRFLTLAAE